MITALQNFISKKGKFVFILLLLLVVVSFVLYLSQGSSVFDLMSDGGREKKEFFGYDWNDPDQRRFLNVTTRAAGAMGAWVSPTQDVVGNADQEYMQSLQQQMQAAFRANQGEVDQDAMQRMFQYMQAWPNFSRDFKVREIARSGAYDGKFLEESIKSHVFIQGQADQWGFMPKNINHPEINAQFVRFLSSLDPSLVSEENRTAVLSLVGGRFGMSGTELESVLYRNFRDLQVDRIYTERGFALPEEVKILSQQNAFAWDGEVAVISAEDLPEKKLKWGEIQLNKMPKKGEELLVTLSNEKVRFVFGDGHSDNNDSSVHVHLGTDLKSSAQNLSNLINKKSMSMLSAQPAKSVVRVYLNKEKLPRKAPRISSRSKSISIVSELESSLLSFFESNKDLDAFMKEPRTFTTALVFESKSYETTPPSPDEARLRSYFDRNRIDFLPDSEESSGAGEENSTLEQVEFQDVIEEVRKKVLAQDLADAKREADRLAQNAALRFLDQLNSEMDQVRKSFPDYQKFRNSSVLEDLLKSSGAALRKISFSSKDMNVQNMVLGLERRASEQRTGKEPLEEVQSLNERKFFTRSVRKSRNGHVVFLLDHKTQAAESEFSEIDYSLLCQQYMQGLRLDKFNLKVDEIKEGLVAEKSVKDPALRRYSFSAKNERSARSFFDAKQRSLRTKIDQAEEEMNQTDPNDKKNRKTVEQLNNQLADLRKESNAIGEILQRADTLNVGDGWVEISRDENQALLGLIADVYSTLGKDLEEEQKSTMQENLELSRAMLSRDETLRELISAKSLD